MNGKKRNPPSLIQGIGLVVRSKQGLRMSTEKQARKKTGTHELQQVRCLSQFRDGFDEETIQKFVERCPYRCTSFNE